MSDPLHTRWGRSLDREHPLPEYPRPQFRRDSYVNLNGLWDYAFTASESQPGVWEGKIVVPFSPESALSGVGRAIQSGEVLHYRRFFTLPGDFHRGRVLLHFGAVDQEAAVFLNGAELGRHAGGYTAFSFDITDALRPGGNELHVAVRDDAEDARFGRGKQSKKPGGIWYTAQSGIWQTVWMESVPELYIRSLRLTPCYDEEQLELEIRLSREAAIVTADVYDQGEFVAGSYFKGGRCVIPLPRFRPWSPEDPHLYQLRLRAGEDQVESYFAMRKFSYTDYHGRKVFALNNRPYFHNGLLDQGYWPDGLLTPPSDEAMVFDIATARALGYNTLRKHIKIEPMRWYYHCDRLGMLVWQDMVNGGGTQDTILTSVAPLMGLVRHSDSDYALFRRDAPASRSQYLSELGETMAQLRNCPCIALWTPFNEGWGQFDAVRIAAAMAESDSTRYVDHASGWHDQGWGSITSRHVYFRPVRLKNDGRALCLSEYGGYSLSVPGHCWGRKVFGYKLFRSAAGLLRAYDRLIRRQIAPLIAAEGLTAAIYTQLTDVESECNGLITYDREMVKLPERELREINELLRFEGQE